MKAIRVLLVDDQRSVRFALRMLLAAQPDIAVVGEANDGSQTVATVCALRPDVVVMDYEMPGMNGVQTIEALRAAGKPCRVVMLSLHDDAATKQAAARAGAHAFVAKHEPADVLLQAIRSAAGSGINDEDTS